MLQTTQVLQGRYQLQKQLGNNAGRQTWLATDIKTSPPEPVTVKLLAFSPQMHWDEFKLFEREASVLKQLNHPRIPNYRDYFSLDKQTGAGLCWFGLVQDYIPGYSLQQLLDEGKRFTEEQVRSLATQVLEILTYLHGLNPPVLHRDIKPSNLILREDKQVYLVDFGAVQDSAAVEGVTFTVVGTTGYAPLEQFWGKAVEASDLYALGATLIHLLTGVPPADLPQRNLRIQFKEQVSINSAFLSWIEALTEPDLNLRLSTANQAIESLQTGRFITCPPQPVYPPFCTQIKVNKSPNQLTIKIPKQGQRQGLLLNISFIFTLLKLILIINFGIYLLGLFLFFVFWGGYGVSLLVNLELIAVSPLILFTAWILWKLLQEGGKYFIKMFKDLFKDKIKIFVNCRIKCNSYIKISRGNFFIEKRYFYVFRFRQIGQTPDINKIFYYSKNNKINVYIRTSVNVYYLGSISTRSECEWLIQEIQGWLAER